MHPIDVERDEIVTKKKGKGKGGGRNRQTRNEPKEATAKSNQLVEVPANNKQPTTNYRPTTNDQTAASEVGSIAVEEK